MDFVDAGDSTCVWFKVLLYGNSGSGKTWRGSQARRKGDPRRVLGLLTEANGVQSARHANPSILLPSFPLTKKAADGSNVPVIGADGKPMVRHYTTSMEEVRDVLKAVINREIPDLDTLFVDGLTEVQALMKDEMVAAKEAAIRDGRAKKGTEIFSQADWGELGEKMRRMMRSLRDLPMNVVCTALAEVETVDQDDETRTRYTQPAFQGRKLANQCAAFQNVVAYCFTSSRREAKGGTRVIDRLAMVEGPETTQCKPAYPLTGILDQPLYEWMDMLALGPNSAPIGRKLSPEEQAALDASHAEGEAQTKAREAKGDGKADDKPGTTDTASNGPENTDQGSGGTEGQADPAATTQGGKGRGVRRGIR